jgi:hypothetical protein
MSTDPNKPEDQAVAAGAAELDERELDEVRGGDGAVGVIAVSHERASANLADGSVRFIKTTTNS